MDDINFRLGTPSDAPSLAVVGAQVFVETYASDGIRAALAREVIANFSAATVASHLADPQTRFIVAERAPHLIGFAQLRVAASHPLLPPLPAAELERLYVLHRYAGAGLGSALLARCEALVAAEGAALLWLTAWIGNERALAFYPRRGYQPLGSTEHVFEEERFENRLYAKALSAAAAPAPPG